MTLRVVITEQAEREMQSAFNWWANIAPNAKRTDGTPAWPKPSPTCRKTLRGTANPEKGIALPMRFATFCLD